MSISSAGIGSGLDINSLVKGLVNAESAPKAALYDKKEAGYQAELSATGIVKSALNDLQTAITNLKTGDIFNNRKASSSSDTTFIASATNSAVIGSYGVEVTQLAEAQKLSSAGFTDSTTIIGTGTLTLTVGTAAFTLTIDDTNKTVAGIRDAINNATDNTGVTATTVNVDNGSGGLETRLVLSANETGTNNAITVTAVNGAEGDLQQLVYDPLPGSGVTNLVERNAALDAIFLIDSQTVTSNSNVITDAVEGVTLTLLSASPGNEYTLKSYLDTASITSNINKFVDSYNEYISIVTGLTGKNDQASGVLQGDALVRSVERQIRTQLTQQVGSISSDYSSLAAIGITTQKDGSFAVDGKKLDAAISSDLTAITNLFSATDGVANVVDASIETYVKFNGIFDLKTKSITSNIDDITEQRNRLAASSEKLESRLLSQFIAMDLLVNQLTATGSFLTDALKNIPQPNSIRRR